MPHTIATPPTPLNPHAFQVADLLALAERFASEGNVLTAQGALQRAWAVHERWPLDLDPAARGAALSALSRGEQTLARLRRQIANASRVLVTTPARAA